MYGEKEKHMAKAVFERTKPHVNVGTIGHIDHGKTTFSDNLLAGAGMMSEALAGKACVLDFHEDEQTRGITIDAANVSMVHEFKGKDYLINLIDTPGHVDFGGDVTRAMRAIDGTIVLTCAVEGVMPQTETVLKQALAERVKPVLFINKVDRAIKELKLTPEQLQKRLTDIVINVNKFIQRRVDPEFKDSWLPKVEDGSVAFGSALRKWAISVPAMKEFGVTFKDIIDLCSTDQDEELAKRAPMHKVVLDMVIQHLPSPTEAQSYRASRVWTGDMDSEVGKTIRACDPNGKLAATITKVVYDPHAGMISTARVFSGTLEKGQNIHMLDLGRDIKVQQVTTFIADKRIPIEKVLAGNVVGIVGLTDITVGETLCDPNFLIDKFATITHIFEPVVTKSIEPKSPQDLPKLINILKTLNKEDPTLKIQINQETGETLVSGLGELHLDAKVERKIKEKGVEINVSPPIVVYRETVNGNSPVIEGKSPNKHNKFFVSVEPIAPDLYAAMMSGQIKDMEIKVKNIDAAEKLMEFGFSRDDAKGVKLIYNHNILIDNTKGIQYLNEAMELIKDGFRSMMNEGPLAKEPSSGVIIRLHDAELQHEFPIFVKQAPFHFLNQLMNLSGEQENILL